MRGKLIFLSDVQNIKCRAKQIYSDDKCPVQGLSYHSGGAKRKFVGKSTISLESWQTHTQTQNIQWTLITLMYTETVSRQCSALNILFFSSLQRCSWNWSYLCIRISFFFFPIPSWKHLVVLIASATKHALHITWTYLCPKSLCWLLTAIGIYFFSKPFMYSTESIE